VSPLDFTGGISGDEYVGEDEEPEEPDELEESSDSESDEL
jgi:hypothetical protein